MSLQVVLTSDGSSSLYLPELEEYYHSVHGAIQESEHVFINAGLKPLLQQQREIHILEIGFGTGLNTLLTCLELQNKATTVYYTAIEKYPLSPSFIDALNYTDLLQAQNVTPMFASIHQSKWEVLETITQNFYLQKCKMCITNIKMQAQYDLIYFDAFAPSAQPELWTADVLKTMYACLKENGVLVTYCAKGEVKRTLKSIGFKVEALPGPPGKREMTKATKFIYA